VTNGPDVDMGLVALELLLRHFEFAPVSTWTPVPSGDEPGKSI
jgi:hypothetical protein